MGQQHEIFQVLIFLLQKHIIGLAEEKLEEDFGLHLLGPSLFLNLFDELVPLANLLCIQLAKVGCLFNEIFFFDFQLDSLFVLYFHEFCNWLVQNQFDVVNDLLQLYERDIGHSDYLEEWLDRSQNLKGVGSYLVESFVTDAESTLLSQVAAVGWHSDLLLLDYLGLSVVVIVYQLLDLAFVLLQFFFDFVENCCFIVGALILKLYYLLFVDYNVLVIV